MRQKFWQWLFAVLTLILASCATTRPPDAVGFRELVETRAGYAKLYIYRPHHEIARGVWPEIFLNEKKIVGLKNDAYTVLFVRPGHYKIRTEAGTFVSGIQNIPGEVAIPNAGEFFLKFDRSYNQFTSFSGAYASPSFTTNYERWILVSREVALAEISKCYYIAPYVEAIAP